MELLRDELRAAARSGPDQAVTVVPLAPLTNIALLPHGVAPTVVDVALHVDDARYANLWLETMGRARDRSGAGAG